MASIRVVTEGSQSFLVVPKPVIRIGDRGGKITGQNADGTPEYGGVFRIPLRGTSAQDIRDALDKARSSGLLRPSPAVAAHVAKQWQDTLDKFVENLDRAQSQSMGQPKEQKPTSPRAVARHGQWVADYEVEEPSLESAVDRARSRVRYLFGVQEAKRRNMSYEEWLEAGGIPTKDEWDAQGGVHITVMNEDGKKVAHETMTWSDVWLVPEWLPDAVCQYVVPGVTEVYRGMSGPLVMTGISHDRAGIYSDITGEMQFGKAVEVRDGLYLVATKPGGAGAVVSVDGRVVHGVWKGSSRKDMKFYGENGSIYTSTGRLLQEGHEEPVDDPWP